jgi:hypothetical protein
VIVDDSDFTLNLTPLGLMMVSPWVILVCAIHWPAEN